MMDCNLTDWDIEDPTPYGPPQGDDPEWLCGDGATSIPLSEIEDSHLLNIERFLIGRGRMDAEVRKDLFTWWYQTIRDEIDRRGLDGQLLGTHMVAILREEQ